MANKKPTIIDGIIATSDRDVVGETLNIDGCDISALQSGMGRINDNHMAGFSACLGRVIDAKKIYKKEDCEDERQQYWWEKAKKPFIYMKGCIFDDQEEHESAKALSSIMKHISAHSAPLAIKASVEGGIVERGGSDNKELKRTRVSAVALTFSPANPSTAIEPVSLSKTAPTGDEEVLIKNAIASVRSDVPNFIEINENLKIQKISNNINKINELAKTLKKKDFDLIEDESLNKNLKNTLTAAGLATAMTFGAPYIANKMANYTAKKKIEKQNLSDKENFLNSISQVESSGGKNLKHPKINNKNSSYHGMRAGGSYGIMPLTAMGVLKKNPDLAKKHKIDFALNSKNHGKMTNLLNTNSTFAKDIASSLYDNHMSALNDHIKSNNIKIGNNDIHHVVAYSWFNGINGTKKLLSSPNGLDKIGKSEYVKKYNKNKELNKSLSAGFGAAGAPGNLTGGGVMQSESVVPSFKYITCPSCGKEQIHQKNQIRCRNCGKNFKLKYMVKILV